ncbi:hypothetical protein CDL15_Pgr014664 [Punica granatum]|nr:hypothetical protein CDL15_Pgr014664 [Punica granatum]
MLPERTSCWQINMKFILNNLQAFRHIPSPRWTLGWTWASNEVIWSALGAQAKDQSDCSKLEGNIPHGCNRTLQMVDLLPDVPKNMQFPGCRKGGVLLS